MGKNFRTVLRKISQKNNRDSNKKNVTSINDFIKQRTKNNGKRKKTRNRKK